MIEAPVVVRRSGIQGRGVYAARFIRKGAVVVRTGPGERHYTAAQMSRFSPRYRKTLRKYGYWEGGVFVYPTDAVKYLNHSCSPNVRKDGPLDRAARDIRRGEELTYDYSALALEKETFVCRCGSAHCKGVITFGARRRISPSKLRRKPRRQVG